MELLSIHVHWIASEIVGQGVKEGRPGGLLVDLPIVHLLPGRPFVRVFH